MVFDYSEQIYRLSQNAIRIASLLSNHIYRYTNRVECISQLNLSDTIKVTCLAHSPIPMKIVYEIFLLDLHPI